MKKFRKVTLAVAALSLLIGGAALANDDEDQIEYMDTTPVELEIEVKDINTGLPFVDGPVNAVAEAGGDLGGEIAEGAADVGLFALDMILMPGYLLRFLSTHDSRDAEAIFNGPVRLGRAVGHRVLEWPADLTVNAIGRTTTAIDNSLGGDAELDAEYPGFYTLDSTRVVIGFDGVSTDRNWETCAGCIRYSSELVGDNDTGGLKR